MILSIDESGDFSEDSTRMCIFVATHLRQRKTLYKLKEHQFLEWERGLPKSLKNPKGEIKSSALSDLELHDFVRRVVISKPYLGITPIAIIPNENPSAIVRKHKEVQLRGIAEGVKLYRDQGKDALARSIQDFHGWFNKLSYPIYLKIIGLGECIVNSLSNAIGHSVAGKYDQELVFLRIMIDRDFVRNKDHLIFWRHLLRNQLWHVSKHHPIPLLDKWKEKGHPFLSKYSKNGRLDLGDLLRNNLDFYISRVHFEIRIADAISVIISRFYNERRCTTAYNMLKHCFLRDGRMIKLVLNDIDPSDWMAKPDDNPYLILSKDPQAFNY